MPDDDVKQPAKHVQIHDNAMLLAVRIFDLIQYEFAIHYVRNNFIAHPILVFQASKIGIMRRLFVCSMMTVQIFHVIKKTQVKSGFVKNVSYFVFILFRIIPRCQFVAQNKHVHHCISEYRRHHFQILSQIVRVGSEFPVNHQRNVLDWPRR